MTTYADSTEAASRPADLAAERVLAASVMARPDLIDTLAGEFDPADFSDDRLRWVWHAVDEIRNSLTAGQIPWEAVDRQLRAWAAAGQLPIVPLDRIHLSELYDHARPASADYFAARITTMAVAARMAGAGFDMTLRARSADFDPEIDVAAAQAALDSIVRPGAAAQAPVVGDLLAEAMQRAVTPPRPEDRIPTGFNDLDSLTGGGFTPGRLIIVGARPGIGKTTLGNGFARAAAIRYKIPSLIVTMEMGRDEIMNAILSAEARVGLHHITGGYATDTDVARMIKVADKIQIAPLYIDDNPSVTLASLRGQVRHLVRTTGLRLVVIDYLQLMQAPRAENRQVAVATLSRGLKLMAKEFGIVVVVLAQLNRGSEHRTDKKPTVSDLRESGGLEQDADMVILIHREDAYNHDTPRAGEVDLIVGKHRAGPTATITVAAQLYMARFVDMAQT